MSKPKSSSKENVQSKTMPSNRSTMKISKPTTNIGGVGGDRRSATVRIPTASMISAASTRSRSIGPGDTEHSTVASISLQEEPSSKRRSTTEIRKQETTTAIAKTTTSTPTKPIASSIDSGRLPTKKSQSIAPIRSPVAMVMVQAADKRRSDNNNNDEDAAVDQVPSAGDSAMMMSSTNSTTSLDGKKNASVRSLLVNPLNMPSSRRSISIKQTRNGEKLLKRIQKSQQQRQQLQEEDDPELADSKRVRARRTQLAVCWGLIVALIVAIITIIALIIVVAVLSNQQPSVTTGTTTRTTTPAKIGSVIIHQ